MEITLLSDIELALLWALALVMPFAAHAAVRRLSRSLDIEPGRALPRVAFLTAASVLTLIWLTGSRFAAIRFDDGNVSLHYSLPTARTRVLAREEVARVSLDETTFPRTSYAIRIESRDGASYRSVGVTPAGLEALYKVLDTFHPGETPYVALRDSGKRPPF